MEIIYFLIPISLVLLGIIVGLFLWSVKSGQFDDMEGPAYQILMDDKPVSSSDEVKIDSTSAEKSIDKPSDSDQNGSR